MKLYSLIFIVSLNLYPIHISANALGLAPNTARLGIAAGLTKIHLIDNITHCEITTVNQTFSLLYSDWFLGGTRYWLELLYTQANFDASETQTEQELTQINSQIAIQRNFPINDWLMPWLGMGLSIYYNQFTQRRGLDEKGLLSKKYADRTENIMGLTFSVINEWPIATQLDITTHIEHFIALGDRQRASSFKIAVLYRY